MFSSTARTVRLGALLTLAAGSVMLSGCVSVQTSDDASSSPVPAPSASIDGEVTPSPKNPDGEADGDGNVPRKTALTAFDQTFDHIKAESTEHTCKDGEDIDAQGEYLYLEGACTNITVSGAGNMIAAENIGMLTVTGQGNAIAVASLDSVEVTGLGKVVGWQSEDTEVSDSGESNTVSANAFEIVDLPV